MFTDKAVNHPDKNLVIAVVGDDSLHYHWMEDRDFDLFIIYYGDEKGRYANDGEYYMAMKGIKFNLIHEAFATHHILSKYRSFLMPDDDLITNAKDIKRFFDVFNELDMYIGQPSIMGYFSWAITLHHPSYLVRYTNRVENMTPCFSQFGLRVCLHSFAENKSGWGLGMLWDKWFHSPEDKIGIIDEVVFVHTREAKQKCLYENHPDFDPHQEKIDLMAKHDLTNERKIYWDNSITKSFKELEYRGPMHKISPSGDIFKRLIPELRKSRKNLI